MGAGEEEGQAAFDLFAARAASRRLPELLGLDEPVGMVHAVLFQQLLATDGRLVEQWVADAAVQRLFFLEQQLVVECGLGGGKVADGQVQLILQQASLQFGRHGAEQFDLHRLVALAKTADGGAQPFQHLVIQCFGQANVEAAEQLVGHALGLALEGVDGAEQLARGQQHLLALGGQTKAGLAALAQAKAQARLQLGHLRADG
ncbi:hypothetical protein D3C85_639650 [compost metagenome]